MSITLGEATRYQANIKSIADRLNRVMEEAYKAGVMLECGFLEGDTLQIQVTCLVDPEDVIIQPGDLNGPTAEQVATRHKTAIELLQRIVDHHRTHGVGTADPFNEIVDFLEVK